MSQFEYVAVFVSIIAGLGVVHLLLGIARLITNKDRSPYWLHLLWTLNVFNYLIFFWWTVYRWTVIQEWRVSLFVWVLAFAIVLYLLCAVLFPPDDPGTDYRETFYRNRKAFFGLWIVVNVFEIVDTSLKSGLGLVVGGQGSRPPEQLWLVLGGFALVAVGHFFAARSTNPRFHAIWGVFWFIWTTGYFAQFSSLTPQLAPVQP